MWRIARAGDGALLVTLGTSIDPALLGRVLALDRDLHESQAIGLVHTVAAYASLLCRFDPDVTDAARLEAGIRELEGRGGPPIPSGPLVGVPTRYHGPDLPQVAPTTRLTPPGVVHLPARRR